MKFQRSTLILFLSALMLGGFVYVYEIQGSPVREAAKTKQQQIFSFQADEVQSITVTTKAQTLTIARLGDNKAQSSQPIPSWSINVTESPLASKPEAAICQPPADGETSATCQPPETSPLPAAQASPTSSPSPTTSPSAVPLATPTLLPSPGTQASPTTSPSPTTAKSPEKQPAPETNATKASQGAVDYLMNLLVAGKSDRKLVMTDPDRQRQEFGLDSPKATIEVKLKNQTTHRLIVGKPDFNNSFLYAQADPPADKSAALEVLLVSTNFQNAVDRPLSEWKQETQSSQESPKTSGQSKDNSKATDGTSQGTEGSPTPSEPPSSP